MGRSPCCRKSEGVKKGPWEPEEDEKLVSFISQYGHGNWQALPKKCGLLRCGKSCRLRWTNYLRPDIVRGGFTPSEEQKIIQLHGLVGNKWAFIASHLPKRTDNEIKNYWNTVLKKRLRNLGLYFSDATHSQISSAIENFNSSTKNKQSLNHSPNHPTAKNTWQLQQQHRLLSMSSKSAGISSARHINQDNAAKNWKTYIRSDTASHLAQWEMARLEAEARLSGKQSTYARSHANLPKSDWSSFHSGSSLIPNVSPLSNPSVNSSLIALQLSPSTDAINIINARGGLAVAASQQQNIISMIDDPQNDDHAGLDGVVIDGELDLIDDGGLDQNIRNISGPDVYSSASENMNMINASPAMAPQQNDICAVTDTGDSSHDHVKQQAEIIHRELLEQTISDIINDGAMNDLQELLLDTASSSVASPILPRDNASVESSCNQMLTPGIQLKEALQDWLLDNSDDMDDLLGINFSFRRRSHT